MSKENKESRDILFGRLLATIEIAMEQGDRHVDQRKFCLSPASTYATMFAWAMSDNTMRGIIEKQCNQITCEIPKEEFNDKPLKTDYLYGYSKQRTMLDKIFEIRNLRKKTGLSQEAFGKLCGDVPLRTIQNWESGASLPASYVINLIKEKVNARMNQNGKE